MKLNKKIIRKLIYEEINKKNNRLIWERKRVKIANIRKQLLDRGHDKDRIDEFAASSLAGLFSRGVGLGGSEYINPESDSIFGSDGGLAGGIRVALEQTILEKIVTTMGLDPYVGFGLIMKNALEQAIRKYSDDELKDLFSGGDCQIMAKNIAREVLIIIEESSKERVLKFALDSVAGELGQDFQNSNFFKPIYQGMREKFSSAFDDLIDEDEYSSQLAGVICQHMNVSNIFSTATDFAKNELGDAAGEIGGMFKDIIPSF